MARLLDEILVIDVEATCWQGSPPEGEESEIIEVGITRLDLASLERRGKESLLVRPVRSKVSAFCTELTTLTQEQVDSGILFAEACKVLKSRCKSKNRAWASYGDYDRRQFERQCRQTGVGYPFGVTHLNVKNLLALAHGLDHEVGLEQAVTAVGLTLEGTHHRGDDDAWNIAGVLAELLKRCRA